MDVPPSRPGPKAIARETLLTTDLRAQLQSTLGSGYTLERERDPYDSLMITAR